MATIAAVVRWSDNTKELQRNLKEGLNQIEQARASSEALVRELKQKPRRKKKRERNRR
jgi:hypothetical protein